MEWLGKCLFRGPNDDPIRPLLLEVANQTHLLLFLTNLGYIGPRRSCEQQFPLLPACWPSSAVFAVIASTSEGSLRSDSMRKEKVGER